MKEESKPCNVCNKTANYIAPPDDTWLCQEHYLEWLHAQVNTAPIIDDDIWDEW